MEMETRPYFQFMESFEDAINDIEDSSADIQLTLYRAIVRYGLYLEEPNLKGVARTIWKLIKPVLEKQWANYMNGLKGASSGRLGGAKVGNQNAKKTTHKRPPNNPQTEGKTTTDKDKDRDKDKEKGLGKSSSKDEDEDDDFSFVEAFDLKGVPREFVIAEYKRVLATFKVGSKGRYFYTWWKNEGGAIVQAYHNRKAVEEEYSHNRAKLTPKQQKELHDKEFAEWCEKQGYTADSIPPELARTFKVGV